MTPNRQEAYRHLLYAALVRMRMGSRAMWWNPLTWWRHASELTCLKDTADCFHNLAQFAIWHFENFDEARFWEDVARLGQVHGTKLVARYRGIFDDYLEGRAAHFGLV
jgi:hypothetical protein